MLDVSLVVPRGPHIVVSCGLFERSTAVWLLPSDPGAVMTLGAAREGKIARRAVRPAGAYHREAGVASHTRLSAAARLSVRPRSANLVAMAPKRARSAAVGERPDQPLGPRCRWPGRRISCRHTGLRAAKTHAPGPSPVNANPTGAGADMRAADGSHRRPLLTLSASYGTDVVASALADVLGLHA